MLDIVYPLAESQRAPAGQIYYEAFRRKLQPLIGRPAATRAVLTAGLNLAMTMGALADGRLLGIAGLHSHADNFARVSLRASVAALGLAHGVYAWAALSLFVAASPCPADELRVAALAVDAAARGQGVGTRLLTAVFDQARHAGCRTVRLEVVDTNTGARALYERLGFTEIKTYRYPLVRHWLGFSGQSVLIKKL
jgi:ribosomal protein S18 acetylase RimI-like enzyme